MKACLAITSYFGQNRKKLFLEKTIASFWITNGTVKIKLLNDQVRSFTREVDFSALTHQGLLAGTDRNQ